MEHSGPEPGADSGSSDVFTVGHSNLPFAQFVQLLKGAGIDFLLDVRSRPASARNPHFSQPMFETMLRAEGIGYAFLGEELGGRPADPDLYRKNGTVDYEACRKSFAFQAGIERVAAEASRHKVALLCAEEDPLECHRFLMISPALVAACIVPRVAHTWRILPCVRPLGYNPRMPRQQHYYSANHLHFITASTYRRARLFDSERFRRQFVSALDELRTELEFRVIGYVLMPEHFHLLLWPSGKAEPSRIVQSLKERTAKFILKNLRSNRNLPWCGRMLEKLTLPPTVHLHGPYRVWQRRFYDFNVWSEKKRLEKLNYMHGNPVKRRLVDSPENWRYSSFRFFELGDASVLKIDHLP